MIQDRGKKFYWGRLVGLTLLVAAAAIFILAPLGATESQAAEKTLLIGVPAGFTGPEAALAADWVRGIQLAIDEINANGGFAGYQGKLVKADTKDMKPDQVLSAINRLLANKNVHACVTGWPSSNAFEIEDMARGEMPYVSSGSAIAFKKIVEKDPDKYITQYSYSPTYYGYQTELPKRLEEWAEAGLWQIKQGKKVALITSDIPYSLNIYNGLIKTFTEMGWTVTQRDEVPGGRILDWGAFLGKVRANPPDVVVNADYLPSNSAIFTEQFLDNPTNSVVFSQYGPSVPEYIDLIGDKSTGIIYDFISMPLPGARYDHVYKIYKEKYPNLEPDPYVFSHYDMVYAYLEAVNMVGDPTKHLEIGRAFLKIDTPYMMGRLKFHPKWHTATEDWIDPGKGYVPTIFKQIWDGKHYILWPDEFAQAEFRLPPWIKY